MGVDLAIIKGDGILFYTGLFNKEEKEILEQFKDLLQEENPDILYSDCYQEEAPIFLSLKVEKLYNDVNGRYNYYYCPSVFGRDKNENYYGQPSFSAFALDIYNEDNIVSDIRNNIKGEELLRLFDLLLQNTKLYKTGNFLYTFWT